MSESLEFVCSAHPRVRAKRAGCRVSQFRSSVLDGRAQAYKTPLTTILAASAGLIEMGKLSETQADLVALIDDQVHLPSILTAGLLATARLDAREVEIRPRPMVAKRIASFHGGSVLGANNDTEGAMFFAATPTAKEGDIPDEPACHSRTRCR